MRNPHLANVFYRPHLSALCLQSQRVEPLFQAGGGGMAIEQPAFADVGAGGADLQVLGGIAEAAAAGCGEQYNRLAGEIPEKD